MISEKQNKQKFYFYVYTFKFKYLEYVDMLTDNPFDFNIYIHFDCNCQSLNIPCKKAEMLSNDVATSSATTIKIPESMQEDIFKILNVNKNKSTQCNKVKYYCTECNNIDYQRYNFFIDIVLLHS